jgi:hypothetical protein
MIVYNITFSVDRGIEQEWLEWVRAHYIPYYLETGCFHDSRLLKLLSVEVVDHPTYACQFFSPSVKQVELFEFQFLKPIEESLIQKFGTKCPSFSTVLKELDT